MGVVGDGERDLRRVAPPGCLIVGDTYEFSGQPGEQGGMVGRWLPADPVSRLLGPYQAHAEKAQVNVVGRHRTMHPPDGVEVAGGRGRISIVAPSARSAYTPLAGSTFMPTHL
jgi:hypothetical protein